MYLLSHMLNTVPLLLHKMSSLSLNHDSDAKVILAFTNHRTIVSQSGSFICHVLHLDATPSSLKVPSCIGIAPTKGLEEVPKCFIKCLDQVLKRFKEGQLPGVRAQVLQALP